MKLSKKVYNIAAKIPKGKVTTYGSTQKNIYFFWHTKNF